MTAHLKNVVILPAFYPNFYGGVEIKPFGRLGIQVFSVMLLAFSSGFYHCPDMFVVNCEISFSVLLRYPAVLVLVLEPDRSQGQLSPGSLPRPVVCCPLSWLPFFSSILVLHLWVCPLIPYSYLVDYYLENWGTSEANMIVLFQYFAYILGDYMEVVQQSLNLALPKFLNRSHL